MKKDSLFISLAVVVVVAVAGVSAFFLLREPPSKPSETELALHFPGNSQAIFENSDRFILYRVDGELPPAPAPEDGEPAPTEANDEREKFHNYPIISKTLLKDKATRQKIIDAYYKGLARASTGDVIACFNPHHGIRAEKNGEVVEMLICFKCMNAFIYAKGQEKGFTIDRESQAVFDEVLNAAGVKR